MQALRHGSARHASARRLLATPAATAVQTPVVTSSSEIGNNAWAICRVGGVRQFLEVGHKLAVSTEQLEASMGKLVRFKEVVAAKTASQGLVSKPKLSSVVVEGVVEDEFQGPAAGPEAELTLKKVVITAITLGS